MAKTHVFCVLTDPCLDAQLPKVSRYLFPFVLEYGMIAIGAIVCILYTGIGPKQDSNGHQLVARGFKNLIRIFSHRNKMRRQNGNKHDNGEPIICVNERLVRLLSCYRSMWSNSCENVVALSIASF